MARDVRQIGNPALGILQDGGRLVSQTDIERQVGSELPVILDIKAKRGLAKLPRVVHDIEQTRLVVAGLA